MRAGGWGAGRGGGQQKPGGADRPGVWFREMNNRGGIRGKKHTQWSEPGGSPVKYMKQATPNVLPQSQKGLGPEWKRYIYL